MSKFMRVVMVAVVGLFLTSPVMAQGTQGPSKPAAGAMAQDTTKKKEGKKDGKAKTKKGAKAAKGDSTKMGKKS